MRSESLKITRRSLLDKAIGVSFGAFFVGLAYPIFKYIMPTRQVAEAVNNVVKIAKVEDLPPNKSIKFKYGRYPSIVLNLNGTYYAYGAICTHLGCIAHWKDEKGCAMGMGDEIHCVCHAGHYNPITGEVLAGPPPSPLPKLKVEVKNGELFAIGWTDLDYVRSLTTYA